MAAEPPTGTEVYKLIASKDYFDFSKVASEPSREPGKPEPRHPFETLLGEILQDKKMRSGKTSNIRPEGVTVKTLVFKIVE